MMWPASSLKKPAMIGSASVRTGVRLGDLRKELEGFGVGSQDLVVRFRDLIESGHDVDDLLHAVDVLLLDFIQLADRLQGALDAAQHCEELSAHPFLRWSIGVSAAGWRLYRIHGLDDGKGLGGRLVSELGLKLFHLGIKLCKMSLKSFTLLPRAGEE